MREHLELLEALHLSLCSQGQYQTWWTAK